MMEKVDEKDVLFLSKVFEHLDQNNNGKLDYNDFKEVKYTIMNYHTPKNLFFTSRNDIIF